MLKHAYFIEMMTNFVVIYFKEKYWERDKVTQYR